MGRKCSDERPNHWKRGSVPIHSLWGSKYNPRLFCKMSKRYTWDRHVTFEGQPGRKKILQQLLSHFLQTSPWVRSHTHSGSGDEYLHYLSPGRRTISVSVLFPVPARSSDRSRSRRGDPRNNAARASRGFNIDLKWLQQEIKKSRSQVFEISSFRNSAKISISKRFLFLQCRQLETPKNCRKVLKYTGTIIFLSDITLSSCNIYYIHIMGSRVLLFHDQ